MKNFLQFSFSIPTSVIDKNGKFTHAGDVHLSCIAHLEKDGSIKRISIERAVYCGNDICPWVSLHDQEVYSEWKSASLHHATEVLDLVPSVLVGATPD